MCVVPSREKPQRPCGRCRGPPMNNGRFAKANGFYNINKERGMSLNVRYDLAVCRRKELLLVYWGNLFFVLLTYKAVDLPGLLTCFYVR